MSDTLTNIQVLARDYARNRKLSIAAGTGLVLSNQVYRKLASLHKWPELYEINTDVSTATGIEVNAWPDTVRYLQEPLVELQDPVDSKFVQIPQTSDEIRWSMVGRLPGSMPDYYRRTIEKNALKISFRPVPNFVSTIRLSGYAEPVVLKGVKSKTIFQNPIVDDAFALWLAAVDSDHSGLIARSVQLFAQVISALSDATGRQITLAELGIATGG